MRELHLFAGAGGGILGGMLLGHTTVCAVEIEPYCRRVLLQRQRDGILPRFPIWDDITTFNATPWRGRVDIVCGGFPCQDISAAGKGAGIEGARSGLWGHMARVVREIRPRYVFVENSPMLTSRGLGRVLGDLAALGYDARWCVLGACDAGAPHKRERLWILADSVPAGEWRKPRQEEVESNAMANAAQLQRDGGDDNTRIGTCREQVSESGDGCGAQNVADTNRTQRQGTGQPGRIIAQFAKPVFHCAGWGQDPAETPESGVGRVANGVANRVDRLKAIGNGQVPAVAALAWRTLSGL